MDIFNVLKPGTVVTADTINESSDWQRSHLLGRTNVIDDMDRSGSSIKTTRVSGMDVHVTLVKNSAGATLAPGLAVTWKSGAVGTEVGALAGSLADAAGIVDPFLKAAVPVNAYFLIITYGPTKVVAGGAISANATIACGTGGKLVAITEGTGKGKALAAAAQANDVIRAFVDFRGLSTYVAPA